MEAPISASNDDQLLEFHDQISSVAERLTQIDPNDLSDDPESIKRFKAYRLKWQHVVEEVEIGILKVAISRLTALDAEFKAGTQALTRALQEANDMVAILSLTEKMLLIMGQIITLAV